ncbi:MAG: hypothetical protein L0177_10445 [Chloroflexi bacterium]|nr:hypothetical protein [Chloroflexota bacterium]
MKILISVLLFAGFWAFALLYVVAGPTDGGVQTTVATSQEQGATQPCDQARGDEPSPLNLAARLPEGYAETSKTSASDTVGCDKAKESDLGVFDKVGQLGIGRRR